MSLAAIAQSPATNGTAPFLELRGVCKSFGEGAARTEVLSDIDLSLSEGEFLAIVGFSGSGKTTLINLIAGLIRPDSGRVALQGKTITGPGPDRGVVFQGYALLPWLTVLGNVQLAVDAVFSKRSKRERTRWRRLWRSPTCWAMSLSTAARKL